MFIKPNSMIKEEIIEGYYNTFKDAQEVISNRKMFIFEKGSR